MDGIDIIKCDYYESDMCNTERDCNGYTEIECRDYDDCLDI